MQVVCPQNRTHKYFYVTAHVTERWIVDESGEFSSVENGGDSEVLHRPDSQDYFTCIHCGTQAAAVE